MNHVLFSSMDGYSASMATARVFADAATHAKFSRMALIASEASDQRFARTASMASQHSAAGASGPIFTRSAHRASRARA